MKDSPSLNLTFVVGPHCVGKTKYCEKLREERPSVIVLPYDSMLYSLRGDFEVNSEVVDMVTDALFIWMWSLGHAYPKSDIVIDGFPLRTDIYRRFFECCEKAVVVHLMGNYTDLQILNNRKRRAGLPNMRGRYMKHYYQTHGFLTSKAFLDMMIDHDVMYRPLIVDQKINPMKVLTV